MAAIERIVFKCDLCGVEAFPPYLLGDAPKSLPFLWMGIEVYDYENPARPAEKHICDACQKSIEHGHVVKPEPAQRRP